MAIAPQRTAIGIRRHFTTEGVHPYDELAWERRDSRITDYRDGSVAFEQLEVEVPATWSLNATNILAQKYFRGTPAPPSARPRSSRSPTAWSTPSPPGASRTATSRTTPRPRPSATSSSTSS